MSDTLEIFKKRLFNFTQKAKKRTNNIIGTEMEVDQELLIENIQEMDESEMIKKANEIKKK
jgi:hypothetical protein